jgi:hypothetical protein
MRLVLDKMSISIRPLYFLAEIQSSVEDRKFSLSGLSETHEIDSYLGLPSFVGRSRNKAFQFIKEKVWRKLNNWRTIFLSQAGKEILLKVVIHAIPTYCMSIF